MSIKINFVDAQEMHKKYPNTFEVPSKKDLDKLIVGYIVKVAFDNERFWVSVIDINRDKITAVVKNYLLTLPFRYGNLITFELKNVHGISPRLLNWKRIFHQKLLRKEEKVSLICEKSVYVSLQFYKKKIYLTVQQN